MCIVVPRGEFYVSPKNESQERIPRMKIEVAIEVAMCIPRTDPKNCKVYPKNESQEFDPKKSRNVSHQMQQNSRDTFLGTLLGIHYKFLGTILGIHFARGFLSNKNGLLY